MPLPVLDDGVIPKSHAQLAASLTADWDGRTRAACEQLLARLEEKAGSTLYPALAERLPR